jgi:hypothetical protein
VGVLSKGRVVGMSKNKRRERYVIEDFIRVSYKGLLQGKIL